MPALTVSLIAALPGEVMVRIFGLLDAKTLLMTVPTVSEVAPHLKCIDSCVLPPPPPLPHSVDNNAMWCTDAIVVVVVVVVVMMMWTPPPIFLRVRPRPIDCRAHSCTPWAGHMYTRPGTPA